MLDRHSAAPGLRPAAALRVASRGGWRETFTVFESLAGYAWPAILALGAAGAAIGAVGGLLGIGGGVIAVPVLLEVFAATGVPDPLRLPISIGTSHLVVALAAAPAVWGHARAGTLDRAILRAWAPALALGGAIGLLGAGFVPPGVALITFAGLTLMLAAQMLAGRRLRVSTDLPRGMPGLLPPALVGLLAASLGVGAGTLSGPVLGLFGIPLLRAVGAGAVFNLVIAAPAALAYALSGEAMGAPGDAVGQVALAAAALLALPAMIVAPVAARLSRRMPDAALRALFVATLLLIAARVLGRMGG
jgi:uncharacterized membrane protein YfcA